MYSKLAFVGQIIALLLAMTAFSSAALAQAPAPVVPVNNDRVVYVKGKVANKNNPKITFVDYGAEESGAVKAGNTTLSGWSWIKKDTIVGNRTLRDIEVYDGNELVCTFKRAGNGGKVGPVDPADPSGSDNRGQWRKKK